MALYTGDTMKQFQKRQRNNPLANRGAIALFVIPPCVIFTLIVVYPVIMSGYYSFLRWNSITTPTFLGLKNYLELISKKSIGFFPAVVNSFRIAGASLFMQIPLGFLLAMILAKGVKGGKIFMTIYFIPFILSAVVIGQLWMMMYHPNYGLFNRVLAMIGLESLQKQWLADPDIAMTAVIVPIVLQFIGYYMLLLYAGIRNIPQSINDAATIDGAGGLRMFWHITLPMTAPVLKVCCTFAVVGSMKVFDVIYIMTNGGPFHATEVPSTLLIDLLFMRNRYGLGSSIGFFIFVECMVLTVIIQWLFRKPVANVSAQ